MLTTTHRHTSGVTPMGHQVAIDGPVGPRTKNCRELVQPIPAERANTGWLEPYRPEEPVPRGRGNRFNQLDDPAAERSRHHPAPPAQPFSQEIAVVTSKQLVSTISRERDGDVPSGKPGDGKRGDL